MTLCFSRRENNFLLCDHRKLDSSVVSYNGVSYFIVLAIDDIFI